MRKLVTAAFVSVDNVMQAPGGPEEDPSGGFALGGWTAPLFDDVVGAAVGEWFKDPFDLLLGRRTYDIFAAHWPYVDVDPSSKSFDPMNAEIAKRFDAITKFVATHRPESLAWKNSKALGTNVVDAIKRLKAEDGPNLLTQGSTELVHQLLAADLVDELRLVVYPVVLGKGKRLFDGTSMPRSLALSKSAISANGTIIAAYTRSGEVKTGSFASDSPSPAELERRRTLA